jgi:hypothetical protein
VTLRLARLYAWISMVMLASGPAIAQVMEAQQPAPSRPALLSQRWQEDWSPLADPALRTEPFDALKYIPLTDEGTAYLSFGANARERVESLDAGLFGTAQHKSNTYLLDRLEVHADLHFDGWQAFVQLQDDRAPGKISPGPADVDKFDLEQAFIAHVGDLGDGVLKLRVGRQEFGFDLQRFVSTRDGPNVRQAYDALWGDYEIGNWRIISFVSHPTQYLNNAAFDDYSDRHLVLDGFRVERRGVGPGDLAVYYLRYQNDSAHFAGASGREKRNAVDIHYNASLGGISLDGEAMGQQGTIAGRPLLAWAFGGRLGYTFAGTMWEPHPYLQFDTASGNTSKKGTFGTFNPLFPNGSYFPLAGLTSYANLVHLKPAIIVTPNKDLTLQAAIGLQWRETTNDAVYAIPTQAVPNSAGRGHLWSAAYLQLTASQRINAHVTVSAEATRYQVGSTIRAAGGHNATYAMLQVALAW